MSIMGFRSGKTWKKVIAVIYYCLCAFMVLVALAMKPSFQVGEYDLMLYKASFAFLFLILAVVPFALSRTGFLKKVPLLSSESVGGRVAGAAILVILWLIVFGILNSLHTQAYYDASDAYYENRASRPTTQAEPAQQEPSAEDGQTSAEDEPQPTTDEDRELFIADMGKWYGFDEGAAANAYDLLEQLGLGGIKALGGSMTDNPNLKAMQGIVNGHTVNYTAEDQVIFYVQITGFSEGEIGWHLNWRDQLKWGYYDKKVAFDLYATDTGEGFIAYYDQATNEVIPWGE